MDITSCTGGDFLMAEHNILSCTAAEGTHNARLELGTGYQGLLLIGREPRQALGLTAGHQGDFLNRIMVFDQGTDQGVTDFVVSDQALAPSIGEGATLHAGNDPVHCVIDFTEADGFLAAAGGEDRRFIHQVGQISTGEARGATGNAFERKLFFELLVAAMHIKN